MTDASTYTEHRLKVARTARWGLAGTLDTHTTDVWIVLHGYGQLVSEFVAATRWPRLEGTAFVFPEALQRFYNTEPNAPHTNAPVGASWMTRDARLDDIADNHAYLDRLASALAADAPNASISVLGFSQGAATGSRWTEARLRANAPVPRLVLWGGLLPAEVDVGPSAPLRKTSVTYVCGTRDQWVMPSMPAERARLDAASFPFSLVHFEGGHRLDNEILRKVVIGP